MSKAELELENRKIIFDIVKRYLGLHMKEIQRKTEIDLNLVKYHLKKLEKWI
ncbi:MAG: hypothetical protein ACOC85_01560 [Thermoplasmatota archaeon]